MFKNLKIKKKLMVSYIIVALVASISGIVGSFMMAGIGSQYTNTLNNYGFAQGGVGYALGAFCSVDASIHDGISYIDQAAIDRAVKDAAESEKEFDQHMQDIYPTMVNEKEQAHHASIMKDWEAYKKLSHEILEQGMKAKSSQDITKAQNRLTSELDPLFDSIYGSLTEMMAHKVQTGSQKAASARTQTNVSMIIALVIVVAAVALSLILGKMIANGIANPLNTFTRRLSQLAAGDLMTPVPEANTDDEIGEMAGAIFELSQHLTAMIEDIDHILAEMGEGNFCVNTEHEEYYPGDVKGVLNAVRNLKIHLNDTLEQVTQSADQVASGADQVSTGAQALAQGATEQASAVQELSATITDISNNAQKNAETSGLGMEHAKAAGRQVEESSQYMNQMVDAMGKISDYSEEIRKIIATIENIAFQTNILALNAAVEAARAGAAGKGFAVVADEVRNLASKSDQAAKATKELIEHSVNSVQDGNDIVKNVSVSMEKLVDLADQLFQDVQKISTAAAEESESISQITEGIDQISSVVQTNSATSEESAAASQELSGQAAIMKQLMDQFHLQSSKTSFEMPRSMTPAGGQPAAPAEPAGFAAPAPVPQAPEEPAPDFYQEPASAAGIFSKY